RPRPGPASFQSWETSSIPGAYVPRAATNAPTKQADTQLVCGAFTAQPAEIRLARPTRNPPSHRRAQRARGSRVVHIHPPLLVKSTGDLDDSRAVCPISRTSMELLQGRSSPPTLIRSWCQWGRRDFSAYRHTAYLVPRYLPKLRIYTIRSLEKSTPGGWGGSFSFISSSAWRTRSATTRLRNHFRFAGTMYHGAQSVLVTDITSSNALMYFPQSFRSS